MVFLRQHLTEDIVPYTQEGWSWLLHALHIKAAGKRAAPTDKYRGVSLKVPTEVLIKAEGEV